MGSYTFSFPYLSMHCCSLWGWDAEIAGMITPMSRTGCSQAGYFSSIEMEKQTKLCHVLVLAAAVELIPLSFQH